MRDKNLIASVALFSELYNSNSYKNIQEIIAEFIRGAVIFENKYSFNSTELNDLLKKVYGFDIPESVIRIILQNKFKTEIKKENNYYHFNQSITSGQHKDINAEFKQISESQAEVIEDIYKYIALKSKYELTEKDKKEILENVFHILMDNGYSDTYSDLISTYILSKENEPSFRENLGLIKEGLILYQGIKYTSDFNQLGSWENDLTIYLGTEHLFNALGYNGIIHQEIFDDFYKLVTEINLSHKHPKATRRKIELKYLEESKNEIDNFFQTAESIKKGFKTLDPSKHAMETILKNSNSLSDIKSLRVKFDLELKRLGINYQDFNYPLDKIEKYNVVDINIIEELKKISEEKGKHFNEDYCHFYFQIFTKINTFRNGIKNNRFEKCGHLFVTETAFAKYLAHNNLVKFDDSDIPFVKDIDFVTTRFWLALKKGFSNKQTLPKSFDIITKAKIILSSHLTSTISKSYEKLLSDKKSGKLSDEEAIAISYSLRDKPSTPEEITVENLDISLDFLQNENHLEDFYREKVRKEQLLVSTQKENEALQQKLDEFYLKEHEEKNKKLNEEFNKRKLVSASSKWLIHKRERNKELSLFSAICIINIFLIVMAFFISLSKELKEWFLMFGFPQISLIIFYLLVLWLDTLGSKYLFKKDEVVSGWRWLKIRLFDLRRYKIEIIETFKNEYKE